MPKFYYEGLSDADTSVKITGDDVNHIKNVLRLRRGDDITLCDGRGRDYICAISDIADEYVEAKIRDVIMNAAELSVRITLFQGLPKSDKMDFIVQKAVELGVYEIVPVITGRTVVKLDTKKEEKRLLRYNSIALSAAKQSGRGIVPCVKDFMDFNGALEYAKGLDMNIIPYEEAEGMEYAHRVIHSVKGKKSLGIFIGPEGGFTADEISRAKAIGAKTITLGKRILRTETAGLACLSVIMFETEEG